MPQFYAEKMAFAASNPNVVYATLRTTARGEQPWNGGIYRSEDAGRSWHPVNGEGLARQLGPSNASPYMTSNYKEILVDARDPDVVYVGNRDWVSAGVRKTSNGGRNWNPVMHRGGGAKNVDYGWITQWGPAVECMAMSPTDSDRLAVGTSGHLFITRNGGKTWQQCYCQQFSEGRFAGNGLEVTCLHDIVSDPVRPEHLYYCFYDIGLLVSDDHGQTFRQSVRGMKHDGNCFSVVVDPQSPSTLWAGTGEWGSNVGDICRSDNDGQTWKVVGWPESGLPVGQTKHLVLDQQSPAASRRLLVASQGNGLFESRDGGNTWQNLNGILPASAVKEPRGLLLDPKDSHHIVAALGGEPGKGSGIYETHDGGHGWRRRSSI